LYLDRSDRFAIPAIIAVGDRPDRNSILRSPLDWLTKRLAAGLSCMPAAAPRAAYMVIP
jgi:hypothetical protein